MKQNAKPRSTQLILVQLFLNKPFVQYQRNQKKYSRKIIGKKIEILSILMLKSTEKLEID